MSRTSLIAAAAIALAAAGGAHAQELQFTVIYGAVDPGVTETFDVDATVPGVPSAASAALFGGSYNDIDFEITSDSLGHSVLVAGDPDDHNFFGTGTSDDDAYNISPTFTFNLPTSFYDGSSLLLQATPGETVVGDDGTTITVAAAAPSVSATPEPSTWALLMLGVGGIGLMLRRATNVMAARPKKGLMA